MANYVLSAHVKIMLLARSIDTLLALAVGLVAPIGELANRLQKVGMSEIRLNGKYVRLDRLV